MISQRGPLLTLMCVPVVQKSLKISHNSNFLLQGKVILHRKSHFSFLNKYNYN